MCEIEHGYSEIIKSEKNKEKRNKKMKKTYVTYGIPSKNLFSHYWNSLGNEKKKRAESLFKEIMNENFPNLGRYLDIQDHDAHR